MNKQILLTALLITSTSNAFAQDCSSIGRGREAFYSSPNPPRIELTWDNEKAKCNIQEESPFAGLEIDSYDNLLECGGKLILLKAGGGGICPWGYSNSKKFVGGRGCLTFLPTVLIIPRNTPRKPRKLFERENTQDPQITCDSSTVNTEWRKTGNTN